MAETYGTVSNISVFSRDRCLPTCKMNVVYFSVPFMPFNFKKFLLELWKSHLDMHPSYLNSMVILHCNPISFMWREVFSRMYNYAEILHNFSTRTSKISWSMQSSSDITFC